MVKNLPATAGDTGDMGSIPGLGRSPGRGNGHPLQDSCLENPMDRGAGRATVHGATKGWTRLAEHARSLSLLTPSPAHFPLAHPVSPHDLSPPSFCLSKVFLSTNICPGLVSPSWTAWTPVNLLLRAAGALPCLWPAFHLCRWCQQFIVMVKSRDSRGRDILPG